MALWPLFSGRERLLSLSQSTELLGLVYSTGRIDEVWSCECHRYHTTGVDTRPYFMCEEFPNAPRIVTL